MSETNIVQLREFNEVVRITGRKLEALDEWIKHSEKKRNSLQVDIGTLLSELRERVEAGEVGELATWWDWFEDHRMLFRNISRETAKHYMRIAGADDPEEKLTAYRAQGAARQQAFKARQKSSNDALPRQGNAQGEPKPKAVNLDNVVRIPAAPKPPMPSEQIALVEQFVAIFRQMTEEARDKAMTEITAIYRRWKEGEE